jgi:hypothetical protein
MLRNALVFKQFHLGMGARGLMPVPIEELQARGGD